MAQCMFPFTVERSFYTNQQDRYVPVPCGRCPECLKRRASVWGFRLRKEEERSRCSFFVTLTYDSQFVPITQKGFMTLCKRDVQLFIKRLRKATVIKYPDKTQPLKYYAAGEYGSNRKRPHYHLIIFNADEFDIMKAWIDPETRVPIGHVDIGTVAGASISYTVKYINKGRWKPDHINDDRQPEFSLMSKGMGANYLTSAIIDYHRGDLSRAYVTLEGGIRIAMPRYYKDKIFPTNLKSALGNEEFLQLNASILMHLEENEKQRKKQGEIVQQLIAEQKPIEMTEREQFESKKAAISNFARKYNQRGDI